MGVWIVLERDQVESYFASFGEGFEVTLGMSFNIATLSSFSQGQPGSPGLKGESGDLGPQVTSHPSDCQSIASPSVCAQ